MLNWVAFFPSVTCSFLVVFYKIHPHLFGKYVLTSCLHKTVYINNKISSFILWEGSCVWPTSSVYWLYLSLLWSLCPAVFPFFSSLPRGKNALPRIPVTLAYNLILEFWGIGESHNLPKISFLYLIFNGRRMNTYVYLHASLLAVYKRELTQHINLIPVK